MSTIRRALLNSCNFTQGAAPLLVAPPPTTYKVEWLPLRRIARKARLARKRQGAK